MLSVLVSSNLLYVLGGHLAAAWAALRSMGEDGYIEMARQLMDTADKMKAGVNSIQVMVT